MHCPSDVIMMHQGILYLECAKTAYIWVRSDMSTISISAAMMPESL
jgi:hypothetical protein